ncbi:MAG TPA: histidine phosphatase family protein [Gemmatimonadaceae bacterium]|nr:histidine phosphatase family protein [Gemmatimonadaceae bacterium]
MQIIRSGARFMLAAALTYGSLACSQIQHVEAAPVGAIADSMPGADKKTTAPVPLDTRTLIADLKSGGYVIVFRHAPTNRDQADTDPLNYSDTTHQRLLSAKGRELAAEIGVALRELKIPVGKVYTSEYSRAVETGRLIGGGDVTPTLDVTEGGLVATPIENDRRAAALKELVATPPAAGTNTIIVTHKPNLVDAFGADWVSSKEADAAVFKPDRYDHATLVARVAPLEWIKVATPRTYP